MPRIPYPDPDKLSEAKRAILFSGAPVLNLSRMAMHAADPLWSAYRNFAIAARDHAPLEDRLRELVILRVGYLSNSEYEVHHHRHVAVSAGATEAQLEAVRSGKLDFLGERDRAVIAFTGEVVQDVTPSDATLSAVLAHFSVEEVFGIAILIAGYMTTARLLGIGGVETEDED